jgi:dienelactone hydrolase
MQPFPAIAAIVIAMSWSPPSFAAVKTQTVEYKAGDTTCRGFVAYDDSSNDKRPVVLIVHEWWGLNDYPKRRAEQLAALGYVAFAADMFGDGKTTRDAAEAKSLSGQFISKPDVVKARTQAALETARRQPHADPDRVAAIGYCFGGFVVLGMARAGMDLDGVVSFHGGLATESPATKGQVKSRILICHGNDDTFLTPQEISNFQKEMTDARVDWQMNIYSGAVHAFTNPDADKAGLPGVAYHKLADQRSWEAMKLFFQEIFARK